ncbi:hypothetical protein GobsT_12020 [Gemmata obscuriglobus]|uniref:Uncharacterized protein n=1 Tax=Gemmata obscuriglobus TaxID=114 RepID=A0A2Z3H9M3_9BACT|nr:hypothetical protein [Gemmata obscuriglobus]AWM40326.1 hypothetical protein C1280_27190 [Gemmata obscuriglobus]QEG26463.1 hypothetical protein GobsT_12020 [Gemmata obscuriglobus]VTS01677.1 Putative uncharacterized protein OS=uncultured archaeon GN=BSM_05640 PE=4 SV=1 [Gemmata obscuriglobus UQM 2246]
MSWTENPPVVVVLARHFNPSIFNPVWLAKHGILNETGDYKPDSVFTGQLVQVVTDDFVLVVTNDQMQFILLASPERHSVLIEEKVGTLIRKLPEVPYRAVGLNFNWHNALDANRLAEETRQLFAGRTDGIYSCFTEPNARFGAYLSKDFGPFRMKLDVKPILVEMEGVKGDRIQFAFNFHHDLPAERNAPDALFDLIGQWNAVRTETVKTIKTVGFREQL